MGTEKISTDVVVNRRALENLLEDYVDNVVGWASTVHREAQARRQAEKMIDALDERDA